MGKRRIEIKKIEDRKKRNVAFTKRRHGLFKKAADLCQLTGADISLLELIQSQSLLALQSCCYQNLSRMLSNPSLASPFSEALFQSTSKENLFREVIAELKAAGASWVQFDESALVMDLDAEKLNAFTDAYSQLKSTPTGLNVIVET
ncbi:hypothetical protein C5167_045666 [Papaver somniferum]|uniref:MADS-box domain-containing protein n=1 Tax=Papaver somniferum TaxID=3469 RepID=A0A4Y7LBN7_PAPSO|nr:hypothetical protein C5167_045666 [Papaver somniferum]